MLLRSILAISFILSTITFYTKKFYLHNSFLDTIVLFLMGCLMHINEGSLGVAILVISYQVIKTLFFGNHVNQENENEDLSAKHEISWNLQTIKSEGDIIIKEKHKKILRCKEGQNTEKLEPKAA